MPITKNLDGTTIFSNVGNGVNCSITNCVIDSTCANSVTGFQYSQAYSTINLTGCSTSGTSNLWYTEPNSFYLYQFVNITNCTATNVFRGIEVNNHDNCGVTGFNITGTNILLSNKGGEGGVIFNTSASPGIVYMGTLYMRNDTVQSYSGSVLANGTGVSLENGNPYLSITNVDIDSCPFNKLTTGKQILIPDTSANGTIQNMRLGANITADGASYSRTLLSGAPYDGRYLTKYGMGAQ